MRTGGGCCDAHQLPTALPGLGGRGAHSQRVSVPLELEGGCPVDWGLPEELQRGSRKTASNSISLHKHSNLLCCNPNIFSSFSSIGLKKKKNFEKINFMVKD